MTKTAKKMVECRVNGRRYYRQTESIEMDAEKSILYINVVVLDASEAIKDRVRIRVEDYHLPKRLRRVVTAAATGIAGKVFTLHKITKKVSKKIRRKLPEKMFLRGITAVIEEVFREGPYVVFQLEIKRVDLATLTQKQLDRQLKAGRNDDGLFKRKGGPRDKKELRRIGKNSSKRETIQTCKKHAEINGKMLDAKRRTPHPSKKDGTDDTTIKPHHQLFFLVLVGIISDWSHSPEETEEVFSEWLCKLRQY
jgi:hypothetical protein